MYGFTISFISSRKFAKVAYDTFHLKLLFCSFCYIDTDIYNFQRQNVLILLLNIVDVEIYKYVTDQHKLHAQLQPYTYCAVHGNNVMHTRKFAHIIDSCVFEPQSLAPHILSSRLT